MARLARAEVFASEEIAVVHVMNRTVRRCFLLGDDSCTGRDCDHRKLWIDDQLDHQARHFSWWMRRLNQSIARHDSPRDAP